VGNGDDFMKKVALGLYGAGGFGREVAALLPTIISRLFPRILSKDFLIIFIDDKSDVSEVNGKKILSKDDFLKLNDYELYFCVTIADCRTRKLIVESLKNTNAKPLSLIFNDTIILDESNIGVGTIIMPGSKISTSVIIGDHVLINFNSFIGHDCVISDFVTIAPSVTCCGNTVIGECTFIGAASVIKEGMPNKPKRVGQNSKLGIGSNLLVDLPDNQLYFGNPAKYFGNL
jgi:sugar O-acyltransferase (sialic acid O-acetyltransferase NeuD family)